MLLNASGSGDDPYTWDAGVLDRFVRHPRPDFEHTWTPLESFGFIASAALVAIVGAVLVRRGRN